MLLVDMLVVYMPVGILVVDTHVVHMKVSCLVSVDLVVVVVGVSELRAN